MSEFFESEGPRNLPLETPYTPPEDKIDKSPKREIEKKDLKELLKKFQNGLKEEDSLENPIEQKEASNPEREDSQLPIQTNTNNSGNTDDDNDDDDDKKKNGKDPVINDTQKIDRI